MRSVWTGDEHELELLHLRELRNDFTVNRRLAFRLDDGLDRSRTAPSMQGDLLHRPAVAAGAAVAAGGGGAGVAEQGGGGFGTRSGSHASIAMLGAQ
jgi:hypothetical protein